jgi:hypothetical protein
LRPFKVIEDCQALIGRINHVEEIYLKSKIVHYDLTSFVTPSFASSKFGSFRYKKTREVESYC